MTHLIREQDDYDRTPDPADMTYVEAQICNNISNCGNEIDMIDGTVRLLVQQALLHWGLACDQRLITVDIKVHDVEEAITWIDHPRKSVNFDNLGQHVIGLNASITTNSGAPFWMRMARGPRHSGGFRLEIREKDYDSGD